MKLENFIKIAEHLNKVAIKLIPYSSNRPNDDDQPFHRVFWLDVMRASNDEYFTRQKLLNWHLDLSKDTVDSNYAYRRVRDTFFNAPSEQPTLEQWDDYIYKLPKRIHKTHHKDGTQITTLERIESAAKNAVKFGIGNCGEYARLIVTLLLEYPEQGLPSLGLPPLSKDKKISIELVTFTIGNNSHTFVVCNRDQESNLYDMSTWGNAIIIDPWYNEVISVAEHLRQKHSTSKCFTNLSSVQRYFNLIENYCGFVGDGHSQRWRNNRANKQEPINLAEWPAYRNGEEKENVPWVEDYIAKKQERGCLGAIRGFFARSYEFVQTTKVVTTIKRTLKG